MDSIQVPWYTLVRIDKCSNIGGGCAIYVNENISFERKVQFVTSLLEIKLDYKKVFHSTLCIP